MPSLLHFKLSEYKDIPKHIQQPQRATRGRKMTFFFLAHLFGGFCEILK